MLAWIWMAFVAPVPAQESPPAVIHITDLYRPPQDPDDHFDLACAFALARQGYIELVAVVIEAPQHHFAGDPDVMAVAQLNRLTGLTVPVVAGTPVEEPPRPAGPPSEGSGPLPGGTRRSKGTSPSPAQKIEKGPLLELLGRSARPVVLVSTGSCRDVAQAVKKDPKLFSSKVAAVYLNAGVGSPESAYQVPLEYNVALAPKAYQAMFSLPVPMYWLPCFEGTNTGLMWRVCRNASFYRFRQEEVFRFLAPHVQNYFLWMLESAQRESSFWKSPTQWLRCLEKPVDAEVLSRHGRAWRNGWCTASSLHAAGLTVTREGQIVPQKDAEQSALFAFEPIQAACNDQGITNWRKAPSSTSSQYILEVRDTPAYQEAMTRALISLLRTLNPAGDSQPASNPEKPEG